MFGFDIRPDINFLCDIDGKGRIGGAFYRSGARNRRFGLLKGLEWYSHYLRMV